MITYLSIERRFVRINGSDKKSNLLIYQECDMAHNDRIGVYRAGAVEPLVEEFMRNQ